jgi:hypothetical protein
MNIKIERLVYLMETNCVLYKAGTIWFYIMYINFCFQEGNK